MTSEKPSNTDTNPLAQPFTLPNGQVVRNRLVKSAMSETLADSAGRAPEAMATVYRRWASGGIGLSVTGNVMVHRHGRGEPGNVIIEDDRDLDALSRWASAAKTDGALIYMQVNHPGRQAPRFLNKGGTVAPSAVPLKNPSFAVPRALTESEIEDLVTRFGTVAHVAERAGFDGVQIHGAHGYLVSQFLSPLTNLRTDRWGGSAENRRRFAAEIYREMRRRTGPDFGVAIKINSADFQRGGTTEDESLETIVALSELGLDFVEISGGTYEAPAMTGLRRASTEAREAYFLSFAEQLRARLTVPLCVTGGWRTGTAMNAALESGAIDFIGLARGLAIDPDFPSQLVRDPASSIDVPFRKTGIAAIDKLGLSEIVWYERQIHRMSRGEAPRADESTLRAMLGHTFAHGLRGLQMRRDR